MDAIVAEYAVRRVDEGGAKDETRYLDKADATIAMWKRIA